MCLLLMQIIILASRFVTAETINNNLIIRKFKFPSINMKHSLFLSIGGHKCEHVVPFTEPIITLSIQSVGKTIIISVCDVDLISSQTVN